MFRQTFTFLFLAAQLATVSHANEVEPYVYIPSTVSKEARAVLATFGDPKNRPEAPAPDDLEGWRAMQEASEAATIEKIAPLLDALQPEIAELSLGGVPVIEVKPRGWKDNGKVLVYTHGGAYTLYSARSTLNLAALTAQATGFRVLSIDYSLAPQADWRQISDEIVAVFKELLSKGYKMKNIGFFGDSAGGGLASTSTLRLRDEGLGTPAVIVLYSPMADVTTPGDSYTTLAAAEPMFLLDKHLRNALDAYADPADQKHPWVSSVYGDYGKGYPPTLIQAGTKELVLSSSVRLYQAMDTAGVEVTLDIYEGMPHVFQAIPGMPEAEKALQKVKAFLDKYMGS
jgi:epsilon-lactone hydrolase